MHSILIFIQPCNFTSLSLSAKNYKYKLKFPATDSVTEQLCPEQLCPKDYLKKFRKRCHIKKNILLLTKWRISC